MRNVLKQVFRGIVKAGLLLSCVGVGFILGEMSVMTEIRNIETQYVEQFIKNRELFDQLNKCTYRSNTARIMLNACTAELNKGEEI